MGPIVFLFEDVCCRSISAAVWFRLGQGMIEANVDSPLELFFSVLVVKLIPFCRSREINWKPGRAGEGQGRERTRSKRHAGADSQRERGLRRAARYPASVCARACTSVCERACRQEGQAGGAASSLPLLGSSHADPTH